MAISGKARPRGRKISRYSSIHFCPCPINNAVSWLISMNFPNIERFFNIIKLVSLNSMESKVNPKYKGRLVNLPPENTNKWKG